MKKFFKTLFLLVIALTLSLPAYALNIVELSPGYYPNTSRGRPLTSADIYVGVPDLDPEIAANQKTLSVQQEDGTIVAVTQPIHTNAGGVPVYDGSPVTLLVEGDYSLKVLDSHGTQIYYVPSTAYEQYLVAGNYYYPDYTEVDQGVVGSGNSVTDILTEVGAVENATLYFSHNSGAATTTYTFTTNTTISDNYSIIVEQGVILVGNIAGLKESNPVWFGAVADGATDDVAAIQAALDSLDSGGTLIVPLGSDDYIISTAVTSAVDGITIDFQGGAGIKCTGTQEFALDLSGDRVILKNPKITGLGTYITSGVEVAALIRLSGDYAHATNVKLFEPEQVGLIITGDYSNIDGILVEGGPLFTDAGDIGTDRQHYGIHYDSATIGSILANVTIKPNDTSGVCIQGISGATEANTSTKATISNVNILDCWDHGIYANLEGSNLSNFIITGCGAKIQMRPTATSEQGNIISDFVIDVGNRTGPLLGDTGMALENLRWSVIDNITILNASDTGMFLNTSTPATDKITDNIITNIYINGVRRGNGDNAIGFYTSETVEFSRNVIDNITIIDIGEDNSGLNDGIWIDPGSDNDDHILNTISNITLNNIAEYGCRFSYLTNSSFENIVGTDLGQYQPEALIVSIDLQHCNFDNIRGIGDGTVMEYVYRETLSGYNKFTNIHGYDLTDSVFMDNDFAATNKIDGTTYYDPDDSATTSLDVFTYNTAGDRTITALSLFQRTHLRDPNGAARTDNIQQASFINSKFLMYDGQSKEIIYMNTGEGAETITITVGLGITLYNNEGAADLVIPAGAGAKLRFIRTSSTTVSVFGTVFEAV